MQTALCDTLVRSQRPLRLTKLGSSCHTVKSCVKSRAKAYHVQAYKVDIDVNGRAETLEVGEDQTILEVALEQGLELSHDCKMGVCMTCPAKMASRQTFDVIQVTLVRTLKSGYPSQVSGKIDQSAGMLDEGVQDKGYALLCVAQPRSDCKIRTIEEVSFQLGPILQSVSPETGTVLLNLA